ncbi:hypothetical protein [Amnibacterium sp.]|uniref:hypothetical protein n=1 Tax=Amnibacterium sp. TaxID=1872496 RepID=UPI003F7C78C3
MSSEAHQRPPRALLVLLLVAAVLCAGVGTALVLSSAGAASYGWTAYAPLSGTSSRPVDLTWLLWRPRIGLALLALGAGSTGALIVALFSSSPSAPGAPRG